MFALLHTLREWRGWRVGVSSWEVLFPEFNKQFSHQIGLEAAELRRRQRVGFALPILVT